MPGRPDGPRSVQFIQVQFSSVDAHRIPTRIALGMLEHIVLFKFKADAPIVDITAACLAMQAQIPGVLEITFGASLGARTYAGCLDRARGYTHAEIVRFRCARDLESYASHAAHVNFVSVFVRPHLESAVCFLLFFRFTEYCTSAAAGDYLPAVICCICFTSSFSYAQPDPILAIDFEETPVCAEPRFFRKYGVPVLMAAAAALGVAVFTRHSAASASSAGSLPSGPK